MIDDDGFGSAITREAPEFPGGVAPAALPGIGLISVRVPFPPLPRVDGSDTPPLSPRDDLYANHATRTACPTTSATEAPNTKPMVRLGFMALARRDQ